MAELRCEVCGNSATDDSTNDVLLKGISYAPVKLRPNGRVECQPCHAGDVESVPIIGRMWINGKLMHEETFSDEASMTKTAALMMSSTHIEMAEAARVEGLPWRIKIEGGIGGPYTELEFIDAADGSLPRIIMDGIEYSPQAMGAFMEDQRAAQVFEQ